jgi:hypothetical protein
MSDRTQEYEYRTTTEILTDVETELTLPQGKGWELVSQSYAPQETGQGMIYPKLVVTWRRPKPGGRQRLEEG